MGKRVKVTTRCGEEYVYQYEQEVETVEIVEGNILIKGHSVYFDKVPEYKYFELLDKKGKVVTAFHISTEEGQPRKYNIYFTDLKVRGQND